MYATPGYGFHPGSGSVTGTVCYCGMTRAPPFQCGLTGMKCSLPAGETLNDHLQLRVNRDTQIVVFFTCLLSQK
jgi:hypothetical protein